MTDKEIPRRPALGRGLAALIPQAPAAAATGLLRLAIERIRPEPRQPRRRFDPTALEELAASIREQGVLSPILVRRHGAEYRIVAGERRWRAAQKAGLQEIPAVVKELGDEAAFEVALIENLQREDLDPLEEAEAYRRLTEEHGLTQEEAARRVGKDRSTVANALRLLRLPAEVRSAVAQGELSMGHARALLAVPDEARLAALAKQIVARGLSVRETERLAAKEKQGPKGAKEPARTFADQEARLQRLLGARARLQSDGRKGRIEIPFGTLDEYERLVELFERGAARPGR